MHELPWIQTLQNMIKLGNLMENMMNDQNVSEVNTYMKETFEIMLKMWRNAHACINSPLIPLL